ncbi:CHASE domain-containing protein [Massilia glaciei]|uniref:Histidine kinase n=1 Tax=Massilia glaciei TaxID=1524097 RepID=A0A2U2HEI9_9BURK|nr:CHASE domain-containing protein [Massilia glaciei]PWF42061.1 histidine kinase [Massilia glaciei]
MKSLSVVRSGLWLGVALSLAVGLLFYFATSKSIESDSQERFVNHARNAQNTIRARIKSYTDVLRGAASLFSTSDPLTGPQFHAYVTGLSMERHFPAIETINFAQYVREADRPAFEKGQRAVLEAKGEPASSFQIFPAGRRADYAVIVFGEPEATHWKRTLGLDILAVGQATPVLTRSRDNGTLITSGRPIAAISKPMRAGLGMRLPIYRRGMPTNNVQERRAAYLGTLGIAFSVPKLVQGVLDEMPVGDVRLTLIDNGPGFDSSIPDHALGGRVLFDSDHAEGAASANRARAGRFTTTLPIDFSGRTWHATFNTGKDELYTGFDAYFPWLAMVAGFVSTMLLYALFHTLSSSRHRAIKMAKGMTRELRDSQAKLQLSHQNLRRLAAHAENIKEGERKRIAREIHDDLGQNLLALRIEADMLASRTRNHHPRLHARAHWTLLQIDVTIKSVRQIINDLRPNVLDLGLNAAVDWQVADFRRRTGIACELVENDHDIRVSDHVATALFRILQESLSNILRHAQASKVRVELRMDGERIAMTVNDNGVGLLASRRHKRASFGLVGIEERINILGGTFAIISGAGDGTTIAVSLPVGDDIGANPAGSFDQPAHEQVDAF